MIYAEEIEFLNKIIFQAYNLGSSNKLDKNASEKVLDDMMHDYLKFRGSELDCGVIKVAVRQKSYSPAATQSQEHEDCIIGTNVLQFFYVNDNQEVSNNEYDVIEDEYDAIKDDLEKEIDAVNEIIASAIEHGGGSCFTNATELTSAIHNYMKVKGISNEYSVISMDYEFEYGRKVLVEKEHNGYHFLQIVPIKTKDVGFDKVIKAIKSGKKAKRKGWNGKEQYIELATNVSYKNTNGETVNADHKEATNCAIAFVGTSGVQLGWLASQADMLANDWIIF
jgi:hypothetical protein